MSSAEVIFRYPLVGRVVIRQPQRKPWEDTTIIIEELVSRSTIILMMDYLNKNIISIPTRVLRGGLRYTTVFDSRFTYLYFVK